MSWLQRLTNTFRAGRVERDIQRELSFHIAERIDQLRAEGLSIDEARLAARQQFGNALRIREETYEMNTLGWLERLVQDIRVTLRLIRRSPGFVAAAVGTLGLGIGATTAVFSVLNGVLLRPLPYAEPEQLVGIWHSAQFQGIASNNVRLSSTMYLSYREHAETFAEFGAWHVEQASVTGVREPEEVPALVVTHGTLPALGVPPVIGRWFSEDDDTPGTPDTAILTYGYWQRRFAGDPAIVGRTLTINALPREVIGVMPRTFRFLNVDASVILPQRFAGDQLLPNDVHAYVGIARLKRGVSLAQANADVGRMLPIWIAERGTNNRALTAARFGPALRPITQDVVGDIGPVLWILMGTIGIVLMIACANVANLLLVRGEGHRHELAVRAALGAGWGHIARQLFAESLALALLGGVLAVGLAYLGLSVLVAIAPATLPRLSDISIDPVVLAFSLIVSLLSALLFGLLPIVKYAGTRGSGALHGVAHGDSRTLGMTRGKHRSQNALVFVQVALAVVLLVAAGLMIRSFHRLRSIDPGFVEPERVQTFRIAIPEAQVPAQERVAQMQQDILSEIGKIPGVASAGFATALPMEMEFENNMVVTAEDKPYGEGIPPLRRSKSIAPGLFKTLGVPLIAGRDFTWADVVNRRRVVIVSDTMARELWGQPSLALGKRLRMGRVGAWNEVVGIVGDVYDSGVDQAPPAIVYWRAGVQDGFGPLRSFIPREITFAIRSRQAGSDILLRELSRAVWAVNPDLPLARVQTLGETYSKSMSRTSFTLVMLAIAGFIALALGIVGIYGVVSYAVTEQRRAIGIRLALGAARSAIMGKFLGEGIRVAGVACVTGLVLSLALMGALSRLLFGISPSDPLTLVSVLAIVLVVTTLATLIPATRAAFVQPMRALRED
ncbi:MAG TPA: ABC transporter permease [Vicinamibacterales bacterium]|nr:ABC transporter permease [Vicinamibacterales bacterium]